MSKEKERINAFNEELEKIGVEVLADEENEGFFIGIDKLLNASDLIMTEDNVIFHFGQSSVWK